MTSFSGVAFVLFCFVFVFMLSLKPRPFVQSSFDMQASTPMATRVSFSFFGHVAFSEFFLFCIVFRFLCMDITIEDVVRSSLPNGVFLPINSDHGLDFLHQLV